MHSSAGKKVRRFLGQNTKWKKGLIMVTGILQLAVVLSAPTAPDELDFLMSGLTEYRESQSTKARGHPRPLDTSSIKMRPQRSTLPVKR